MEETIDKQNSSAKITEEKSLIIANPKETIVGIPVVIKRIEVEVALRTVLVEIRNMAVAINLGNGTLCKRPSVPPPTDFSKGCIECVTLIYHKSFTPTVSDF